MQEAFQERQDTDAEVSREQVVGPIHVLSGLVSDLSSFQVVQLCIRSRHSLQLLCFPRSLGRSNVEGGKQTDGDSVSRPRKFWESGHT